MPIRTEKKNEFCLTPRRSLKLAELQTEGGLNVILQARDGSSSSSRHAQSAAAFANNCWSTATTTTKITKLYNNPERDREREREKRLGKKLLLVKNLWVFLCGCVFFWVFWLLRD